MTMPPMTPSAYERLLSELDSGPSWQVDWSGLMRRMDTAYRDGFLAAVALLREPSEELVEHTARAWWTAVLEYGRVIGMPVPPDNFDSLHSHDRVRAMWIARTSLTAVATKLGGEG